MKSFLPYVSITFVSLYVGEAHAYLDPGTGSLIIQSIIAGVVGGLFVLKTYWTKIKRFFSSQKASTDPDSDPEDDR